MRHGFITTILLALVAGLPAGEAPTHEGVVKQMVAALDKMATTLASVTTQETADAAVPELRKSAKEWVALRGQAEKLPPPTRDEKTRLEKEYKGKLEASQKRLFGEVIRVRGIPGGPEALKEIRSVLVKEMK